MPRRSKIDFTYILLTALALAVAACIVVIVYLQKRDEQGGTTLDITLSSEGVTQETLQVNALTLTPGAQSEYALCLSGGTESAYEITLAFEQTADSTLQNFVDVKVFADGELLAVTTLASLFAGEKVEFSETVSKDSPLEITLCYGMSRETGDEAQGTSATFDVVLTARVA